MGWEYSVCDYSFLSLAYKIRCDPKIDLTWTTVLTFLYYILCLIYFFSIIQPNANAKSVWSAERQLLI